MTSEPKFEAEFEALLAVEPRVTWDAAPPASRVTWGDVWTMRILVAGGLAALAAFLHWFLSGDRIGAPFLFWPMTAVFLYGFVLMLYEWFCYLGVRPREPAPPPGTRSVDILTTWVPGEPRDMVVSTLKAIQRIPYPHTTYLCDEGDDPLMKAVCERLGVCHVTRVKKVGAKAGNINNALRQATGEIAVILDPDHEPAPFFLNRVLGYFDDPKVGFVQCVQGYYNQGESLIARGAAEQTYHFYGPVMTGMHGHGTTQAIGANCAFRRAALDSIDGHATGLAEDMATTLKLYAKGWTSVYVPETLTRGLVPNTFGAYASQQLKWTCGVWDILIESLPAAWPTLGWKNRIHFLQNGLFYLRGVFVLLAILIPILALATGQMPWRITLLEFLAWFGPLFAAHLLIRQTAQRWVMEPSEYGFHIVGGFLMNATWWVHLAGVTSAMRRVRIPYIPTPKDDAASDAWRLAVPNLVLAGLSLAAAIGGLWWDQSPFALLMAGFAVTNALFLGFVSLVAQQKLLASLSSRGAWPGVLLALLGRAGRGLKGALCFGLRRGAAPIALVAAGTLGFALWPTSDETPLEEFWSQMEGVTEKDSGGFLLGTYFPELEDAAYGNLSNEQALGRVDDFELALGQDMNVVSLFYEWNEVWDTGAFEGTLGAIRDRGSIPMVTWMPTLSGFVEARTEPRYYNEQKVFDLVIEGRFDAFIDRHARMFRDHGGPVLLRFAHEMDNPQYPWSMTGGNTPEDFIAAWRYVVNRFRAQGASNVSWVWSPWNESTLRDYYPGHSYVDLVGLTLLNYGTTQGFGTWLDFDALYEPFHRALDGYPAPVLISEFGSTILGGDRIAWLEQALDSIATKPEIAGTVMFNSDRDANWPLGWAAAEEQFLIEWSIDNIAAQLSPAFARLAEARSPMDLWPPDAPTPRVSGPRGLALTEAGWRLTVDGVPIQIRGVAYGVGEGWRAGSVPTRRVVEEDFQAIAAMGANAVRRYGSGWPDRNILHAAEANGLKVMMGFWLDPVVDYAGDEAELRTLEANVMSTVERWKDHPAVLAWGVGNETWGQLKHRYVGPELLRQRRAYLAFVERLAARIKNRDGIHPVMTSLEYSTSVAGAINDVLRRVPSVDAIGVNAYYASHYVRLEMHLDELSPKIPVFLSEFGPRGYWDPDGTVWSARGDPIEPTDSEKLHQYYVAWEHHAARAPLGLGGFAFTWRDRLEGAPTWFGLTDDEGRKKPSYHMFAWAWTDATPPATGLPTNFTISMPDQAAPGASVEVVLEGDGWEPGCALRWRYFDELTMELVSEETSWRCEDRKAYSIDVPGRAGRYRLVAYVSRGDAVTTASYPLVVGGPQATLAENR